MPTVTPSTRTSRRSSMAAVATSPLVRLHWRCPVRGIGASMPGDVAGQPAAAEIWARGAGLAVSPRSPPAPDASRRPPRAAHPAAPWDMTMPALPVGDAGLMVGIARGRILARASGADPAAFRRVIAASLTSRPRYAGSLTQRPPSPVQAHQMNLACRAIPDRSVLPSAASLSWPGRAGASLKPQTLACATAYMATSQMRASVGRTAMRCCRPIRSAIAACRSTSSC